MVALGSGDRLSILVAAGDNHLVIATGSDGEAFLNAFGSALPITNRHVDLLLIAGSKADLPVAAAARTSLDVRRAFVIDGGLTTSLDALNLEPSAILTGKQRIALSPELTVVIETGSITLSGKQIQGWQAVIEHGASRVRIVSDARLLAIFPNRGIDSALVIASKPEAAPISGAFRSLVAPASVTDPESMLPTRLGSIPVMKVESGRATELRFVSGGLRLPKTARVVAPAPTQAVGDPPLAATAETNSAWIASRRLGVVSTS